MDEIPDADLWKEVIAISAEVDRGLLAIARMIDLIYGDDDLGAPPATHEAWAAYRRLMEMTTISGQRLFHILQQRKVANDG